jgi:hypothetical protein
MKRIILLCWILLLAPLSTVGCGSNKRAEVPPDKSTKVSGSSSDTAPPPPPIVPK